MRRRPSRFGSESRILANRLRSRRPPLLLRTRCVRHPVAPAVRRVGPSLHRACRKRTSWMHGPSICASARRIRCLLGARSRRCSPLRTGALRALEVLIPASSVSALNGDEIMPIESGFYLALRSMAATRAILSDSALATFTGDELARELAWRACAGAPVKSTHLAIWLSHDDARIRTAAVALMLNEPSRCAALLDSVASDPDAQVLAMAKAVRARWLADIPKDQFPQSWAVSRMSPDALVPWMPDALSRLQSSRSVAEIASQVLVRIGSPALQPVRDLVDASAQPPLAALLVLVELGVGDTETLGLLLPYMANGAALEHRFGPLISGRCDEVCAALAPWMADAETVVLAARVWEVGSRYPSWLTSSEVLGPPFCASLEDAAKPVRHSLRKCISDAMRHAPTRATLSASKHADVRSRVLMLLRDFDDSTDVQFVVSSLEDSDPEVAARACALLDRAIGAEAAVDRWQSLWPSMRSAAKERVLLRIVGLGAVAAPLIPRIQEWRESAATQDVHADAALLSAASESVDMDSKEVLAEVERSFRTVLVSTDHSLHLRAIRCLEVSPTLANRYWIPLVAALGGENSNAVSFAVRALHTASEHAQEAEAFGAHIARPSFVHGAGRCATCLAQVREGWAEKVAALAQCFYEHLGDVLHRPTPGIRDSSSADHTIDRLAAEDLRGLGPQPAEHRQPQQSVACRAGPHTFLRDDLALGGVGGDGLDLDRCGGRAEVGAAEQHDCILEQLDARPLTAFDFHPCGEDAAAASAGHQLLGLRHQHAAGVAAAPGALLAVGIEPVLTGQGGSPHRKCLGWWVCRVGFGPAEGLS